MKRDDLIGQSSTGASIGRIWDIEPPTRMISDMVEYAGHLKNQTKLLADDTSHLRG